MMRPYIVLHHSVFMKVVRTVTTVLDAWLGSLASALLSTFFERFQGPSSRLSKAGQFPTGSQTQIRSTHQ